MKDDQVAWIAISNHNSHPNYWWGPWQLGYFMESDVDGVEPYGRITMTHIRIKVTEQGSGMPSSMGDNSNEWRS